MSTSKTWIIACCAALTLSMPALAEVDDQMKGALDGACQKVAKDNTTMNCEAVAKDVGAQLAKKGVTAQPEWITYCEKSCSKLRGTSSATASAATAEVDDQMKGALDGACQKVAKDNATLDCEGVSKNVEAALAKTNVTAKPEWLVYCKKSCTKLRGSSAATATPQTAEVDDQMKGALDGACQKVAKDNAGKDCNAVAKIVDGLLKDKGTASKPEWIVYCAKACTKMRGH